MEWRDAERAYEDAVVGRSTLSRMFEESAARHANRPAQQYKGGVYDRSLTGSAVAAAPDGQFRSISYAEMREIVRSLAAGFRDVGVGPDDRVGIFSATRMEWAQCDFGLLAAGAVVTTVYRGSSPNQVEHLLGDPDASGVVVENAELLDRVIAVQDSLDLEFAVVMDGEAPRASNASGETASANDEDAADADFDVLTLGEVYERGAAAFEEDDYESWLAARDPEDLATLIYTSGTTGTPKGVRLTHWNFRANVNQCRKRFGPRPDKGDLPVIDEHSRTVSFLPLAHVFERLSGHYLMFASGATVAYAESPDTLREDFQAVEPTTGTSVPRVYERMYDAIREEAESSPVSERLFEWATDVGRRYFEADSPGPALRAQRAVADALVFRRVRNGLGGNLDFLISGGGSLSPELCALYHGMGMPILEGYGLTETSPVIAVNPPEEPKVGTIGPPVADVEVRVDGSTAGDAFDDVDGEVGELLVKGPNVTEGYWELPAATERAFTGDVPASSAERSSADHSSGQRPRADGASGESEDESSGRWFRTGDVVEIRPDGYIAFRERAKELLVLSTGKNVAPGPIEDAFAASDVIEQCMVVGDGQKFVSAILVPNFETLRARADREGVDLPDDPRALCRDDRVRAWVDEAVEAVNEQFESHERIKQYRLVPEEFTEDNDLLTPTMKKKRRNILDRFADEIDEIYQREYETAQ